MAAVSTLVAVAAIAATAHSIEQGSNQRRLAGQEKNRQQYAQDKMINDQKERDLAADSTKAQMAARQKQRQNAMRSTGRQGTVLTGPSAVGAPAPAQTTVGGVAAKTMIGA